MISLSFKSKILLKRLGGVEKAIVYLNANKNFSTISGIGKATDSQLQEYLIQLVSFGLKSQSNLLLSENDSFASNIVFNYELLKEGVSNRSRNILQFLESKSNYNFSLNKKIEFLNIHIFQPFDFLNVRNSGQKTAIELYNLCTIIKDDFNKYSNVSLDSNIQTDNCYDSEYKSDQELITVNENFITDYESLKLKCSVHTIKILSDLECESNYLKSEEFKQDFINKYFINSVDYYSFKSVGSKTVSELNNMRRELLNNNNRLISTYDTFNNYNIGISPISVFLEKYLCQKDLNELKFEEKYSLQRVFFVMLYCSKFSIKAKYIFDLYFNNENDLSFKQIALNANCSIETVRTTIRKISHSLIPSIINLLKPFKDVLIIENAFLEYSNKYYSIKNSCEFSFNKIHFFPQNKLNSLVFSIYLKPEWYVLNQLPHFSNGNSRVFSCKNEIQLIDAHFFRDVHFENIITFLEQEIYSFESVYFDYDLKILINRYYKENGLSIDFNFVDILFKIISKLKLDECIIDFKEINRSQRIHNKENLKQIIYDFLTTANHAQNTKAIKNELISNNIFIETSQLSQHLNKWNQTFVRVGNGAWALKEWQSNKHINGSVREIVGRLLQESNIPLHISEIVSFFETFREINEVSIISNLKTSENIHFHFFNCSFIGLKNKIYDNYWSTIPRFCGSDLRYVVNDVSINEKDKILALKKKGYPIIHCEYILRKRLENN